MAVRVQESSVRLSEMMTQWRSDNAWSPDIPYLTKNFTYVPLFVYNHFRTGMSEHEVLEDCPLVGFGKTTKNSYQVYLTNEGEAVAFDALEHNGTWMCQLAGEVFQVPLSVLFRIDKEMCNTVHFRRRLEYIRFNTSKTNSTEYVAECWVYAGIRTNLQAFMSSWHRPNLLNMERETYFLYNAIQDIKYRQTHKGAF